MWTNFRQLDPSFAAPLWSTLLSEALVVLPNVGASLVLTATSLEVFIASTLDALAAVALNNSPLWTWINNRKQRSSNPGPEEQFSKLLEILGSQSLTTDNSLWESYQSLRKARNSFAHGGVATLGVAPVTEQQAREFIEIAWQITKFVRDHLPEQIKWPHHMYEVKFTYSKSQRLGTG